MLSLQTRMLYIFFFSFESVVFFTSIYIYIYIKLQFPYDTHGYLGVIMHWPRLRQIPSPNHNPFHSSRIWAPPPVPRPQSLVDQKRSHTKPGGFLLGKKGSLKKNQVFGLPKKRWMWCWYQFHDILFKISSERLWPKGSRRFRFFWILINHCVLTLCF